MPHQAINLDDLFNAIAGDVSGECEVRSNYSGQGMYGRQCYGIVTDQPTAVIEMAASYGVFGAQTDSMGRDTIVYWPSPDFVTHSNSFAEYMEEDEVSPDPPLTRFTVIYQIEDEGIQWQFFQAWAEDGDHAEEQCRDAYPTCNVIWVNEGLSRTMD